MRAAALFALLVFFIGCAGTKLYRDVGAHNVFLDSAIPPHLPAAVHVHEVDPNCGARYLGTVKLDPASPRLGLQPDRPSYLVFSFEGSSRAGTLLEPRRGHRYDVAVTYRDRVYEVRLRETDAHGHQRELAQRELARCRAV